MAVGMVTICIIGFPSRLSSWVIKRERSMILIVKVADVIVHSAILHMATVHRIVQLGDVWSNSLFQLSAGCLFTFMAGIDTYLLSIIKKHFPR